MAISTTDSVVTVNNMYDSKGSKRSELSIP